MQRLARSKISSEGPPMLAVPLFCPFQFFLIRVRPQKNNWPFRQWEVTLGRKGHCHNSKVVRLPVLLLGSFMVVLLMVSQLAGRIEGLTALIASVLTLPLTLALL